MKIVTSEEMRRLEQLAIQEGAQEALFMENAGKGIAHFTKNYAKHSHRGSSVTLLCGKGNNAGDAYAAGRFLIQSGFHVTAYQLTPSHEGCSPLCQKNQAQFTRCGGKILWITSPEQLRFPQNGVLLDGIFGSGFQGIAQGIFAAAIEQANRLPLPRIAIDIPSGLNGSTGLGMGPCIRAEATLFLALPKQGFFIGDAWNHVGALFPVDFGLTQHDLDLAKSPWEMVTDDMAHALLPVVKRNRHKYEAGAVVGIAGSHDMPGAALLASLATLRSGAGLIHLFYPQEAQHAFNAAPFEIMRHPFHPEDVTALLTAAHRAKACFIGPGMGSTYAIKKMVCQLLPQLALPCVIDADALTVLAENPTLKLPEHALLTPHTGEMKKLLGVTATQNFLDSAQQYVNLKHLTLVLKGSPTFVLTPNQRPIVIPRGTPGMATAGSGDVLTGVLAGLLAQGLSTKDAAILGVYLHAVSGEHACAEKTAYGMIASDIIQHLPDAFKTLF